MATGKEYSNKAGDAIGWTDPLAAGRGRGVSLGLKSSSTASSSYAIARVHYDGSASILSGTSDMGQGARTVLKQIAAEELGIDPDRIAIVMGDTSVVPFDSSTSASRSTVFMGNAVAKACRDVKAKLKQMAVQTFAVSDSDVRVGNGSVVISGRELSYEEFLHAHFGPPRGEVIGIGHEGNAFDPAHPLGGRPAFWEMMCAAAEVEVDPEVGMVQIVKLILVSDIGKALNPQQVEAQDEGAAVMGLGHSFMEQLLLDDRGRIRNLGALDYRIPTIQDTAESLHSILIENEDGPGPFGAKGAGEGGILAIAAAVGAAVNEAAGIQLRDLPMTPERVWRAVRDREDAAATEALRSGGRSPMVHECINGEWRSSGWVTGTPRTGSRGRFEITTAPSSWPWRVLTCRSSKRSPKDSASPATNTLRSFSGASTSTSSISRRRSRSSRSSRSRPRTPAST